MRKILRILLLAAAALPACRSVDPDTPADSAASLSIRLRLPEVQTRSAGYESGDVTAADAASWSDWDRLVDGQALYRLTLFLVRKADNQLIGYRDLYAGSPDFCPDANSFGLNGFCDPDGTILPQGTTFSTCARVHFNYLNPMHGTAEKLRSGNYRLYAVANYSPILGVASENGPQDYAGLPDDGTGSPFTAILEDVLSDFNAASDEGLPGFAPAGYPDFFQFKVTAAENGGIPQYVCRQEPQPLSFVTDFLVLSGTNDIQAELVRTYSRIRFNLENESLTEELTLNAFSFDTPFAQDRAFLIDPGDDSRYDPAWTGVPVLDSPHAIHPYSGDGTMTLEPEESDVVYDAYVLESKRGDDKYRYHIDVEYAGISSQEVSVADATPIRTLSALKTAYNAGHYKFLIKPVQQARGFMYDNTLNSGAAANSQRIMVENYNLTNGSEREYLDRNIQGGTRSTALLVASDGTIRTKDGSPVTDFRLDGDFDVFIWSFEKTGDWNFNIMNELTGQYWDKNIVLNDTNIRLLSTAVGYFHYAPEDFVNGSTRGLGFRSAYPTGTTVYLHQDLYGHASRNILANMWMLYPLNSGVPAHAVRMVELQVIDPESRQPVDLGEFRRNDFIRVNMAASIHPDGGFLEFKVIPWVPREGSVTFE